MTKLPLIARPPWIPEDERQLCMAAEPDESIITIARRRSVQAVRHRLRRLDLDVRRRFGKTGRPRTQLGSSTSLLSWGPNIHSVWYWTIRLSAAFRC
jgi:hypothetical protein